MKKIKNLTLTGKFILIIFCIIGTSLLSSTYLHARVVGSAPASITKPTTVKVVLVQFTDVQCDRYWDYTTGKWEDFEHQHTLSDFEDLLASDGSYYGYNSDDDPVSGSFRDYFWEMSKQTYRPSVIILNNPDGNGIPIWVQLINTKLYYYGLGFPSGFYDFIGHSKNAAATQIPGVTLSDLTPSSTVKICYIYAGNFIHGIDVATNYNEMAIPERKTKDNSPNEIQNDKLSHIGFFCHEFGHCMGFDHPDDPGTATYHWCVMYGGQRNGTAYGNIPAPLNPWYLFKLNWANINSITDYMPEVDLEYNTSQTLMSSYYVREFSGINRRYLVENRQRGNTYDEGLPHVKQNMEGGILIWQIDNVVRI